MQYDADTDGRFAPASRRSLAHLAWLAGDFPAAHAVVPTLGWPGRHHRVDGDIWWPHGDMTSAAAYEAARNEAEEYGVAGKRTTSQAQRAFALSFTDPHVADNELELAAQLLTGLDLRSTTLTVKIAALVRNAGTDRDLPGLAGALRAEIGAAGLVAPEVMLELDLAFHHAVRDDGREVDGVIDRLRSLTSGGEVVYYAEIAHHMVGAQPAFSDTRWIADGLTVQDRWQGLVRARQAHLAAHW
ncbi:hypothetical protein [Streptomyces sp. NPDC058583]